MDAVEQAQSGQKVPVLDRGTLAPADGMALGAARALQTDRVRVRVVSMPSWELFGTQSDEYRERVLPSSVRTRVGIEAGSGFGWERWTTDGGAMVSMPGFSASTPGERLFEEFKFTAARAASLVRCLLAERIA